MAKVNLSEDLKVKPRVARNIYLNDAVFLFLFIGISLLLFEGQFEGALKIVFIIFTIAVALWIITKCPINPTRKNWQALCIFIMRDDSVYKPLTLEDFIYEEQEDMNVGKKNKGKKTR